MPALLSSCGGSTADDTAETPPSNAGTGGVSTGGSGTGGTFGIGGAHGVGGAGPGGGASGHSGGPSGAAGAAHGGSSGFAGASGSGTQGGSGGTLAGGNGGQGGAGGEEGGAAGSGGDHGGAAGSLAGQGGIAGSGGTSAGGIGGGTFGGSAGVADPGVISAPKGFGAEPHVAAGPGGRVVAAWIDYSLSQGRTDIAYSFSSDDGATWTAPALVKPANNRVAGDPVLTFDAAGNAYVTEVAYNFDAQGNVGNMQINVAKAPAGSNSFGAPVVVAADGSQYDKPWIRLTKQGAILVTFTNTSTFAVSAARSLDGVTWTTATIVDDFQFRNLLFPCVAEDTGRVYVTCYGPSGIELHWSDDDGMTWPQSSSTVLPGGAPAFDDPTCAARGNDVWVASGLTTDTGDPTQNLALLDSIPIAHSSDGGLTFDSVLEGIDATVAPLGLLPQIALDDAGGLDLVYYAGKGEKDPKAVLLHRRSVDGGKTWATSSTLHSPIYMSTSRLATSWLGDYLGLDLKNGSLYTTFGENKVTPFQVNPTGIAFYRTILP